MPFDAHDHLVPGRVSPERSVPGSIDRPPYVGLSTPPPYSGGNTYTEAEIGRIRAAGRIASQALDAVGAVIRPGVTTEEIDRVAHEFVVAAGAYPSTLGYRGYPKSCCTSVNEVVCHGIPDDTVLRDGDIVNVDITAYLEGMHGDTNRTFRVGHVREEVDALVERTHEAMMRGIKAARPGRQVNIIGRVIETYAKRFGYGVVRDFTGHGVGAAFHTGLIIPHYDSAPQYDDVIRAGMVFTVEPMLTLGTHEWDMWSDDWTVTTRDRSITAQFEHTVHITDSGFELLTVSE
ncbi:type I methionyl aminopeptidase [Leucobacter tardus]|uniref:Methionine aminopeptidase n=1 Tax=Leucobacter tardus TaxID=501483 RepID=A0A939TRJ8_9MICO|nr:type I methionyl aminopeptidase [Leucobacter tardus]MBO2990102.1 type I methionyl aminopeptidase [Leucobacter tardus]